MNPMTIIHVGDVLTRPKAFGPVTHVGVVVGSNLVLQNTPEKGERVATLQDFSAGQSIKVQRTGVHPSIVTSRARAMLANPQRYHVIQNNCEHTATKIVRGIAQSSQLAVVFGLALVGGLILLTSKGK
jgi:hypothetical protein